jgi:hypothetical protein
MGDFNPNSRVDPTIAQGVRGQEDMNSYRVIAEMEDTIHLYMPEATPLLTLSSKARKKRVVNNEKFEWLWKDEYPREITLTGAALIGDTTLDVNDYDDDVPVVGDILQNTRTQEVVRVTTVAANTLTVTRGLNAAGAIDMDAGDKLFIIGRAAEDGATKGTFTSIQDENEYNYCQIFRRPFGHTYRLGRTNLYGGRDPITEKRFNAVEHKKDMELSAYFGVRYRAAGTYHYITASGGLNYFVQSNRWNLGGDLPTKQTFTRAMEDMMRWGDGGYLNGSGTKYLFCSSHWMTIFEEWYKDQIRHKPLDTKLGIVPAEVHTTQGIIMLVKSPILDYQHAGWAFLVDMNHFRRVIFESFDTKLRTGIQDPSAATEEQEYYTDCGWQIDLEAAHGVIYGLPV